MQIPCHSPDRSLLVLDGTSNGALPYDLADCHPLYGLVTGFTCGPSCLIHPAIRRGSRRRTQSAPRDRRWTPRARKSRRGPR